MAKFSQALFDRVCERIGNGESLRAICADDDMPNKATVLRWLQPETAAALRDQYARAREMQADALFDEVLDIADDARNDWMESRAADDAGWLANGENIQRSRLRIDARKWMAGKLRPKVYGDKVQVGGADDLPPIKTEDAGLAKLGTFLSGIASRDPG